MFKKIWTLLSILTITVGFLDIAGWWNHIPSFVLIGSQFHIPLTFNAALCFIMAGIGSLCLLYPSKPANVVRVIMGIGILIFAALTISEDIFKMNLQIDQLCAKCWIPTEKNPGRMSFNSSLCFILISIVMLSIAGTKKRFFGLTIEICIFLLLLISMLGILGYLLDMEFLYSWYGYASMTPVSSLCILFISIVLRGAWKNNPDYKIIYEGHEDQRIVLITCAILLCVSLVVGLVSISKNIHLIIPVGAITIICGLLLLRLMVMPIIHRAIAAESEMRRTNVRLINSEERYELAFKGSHAGVWDWKVGSEYIFSSPYLKALLGYAEHEMPDTVEFYSKVIHPDDLANVRKAIEDHLQKNVPYDIEYRLKTKISGYLWFHALGRAVRDEDGNPLRIVGSLMNISAQKKMEKLKADFTGLISTELKSPLTSIRSALGILLSDAMGVFPDTAKTILRNAKNNCDRLYYLLNEILDAENIESGKTKFRFKIVDVHDLIEESINVNKLYAEKNGIKLRMTQFVPGLSVSADPELLLQVMTNLLSNAIKFSPPHGEVKVIITQRGENVRIAVADQGKGIPEEFQAQVFQRYFHVDSSESNEGSNTVLGLKISKVIIEKFGGTMNFSSGPSQGTVFYFELPRVAGEINYIKNPPEKSQ
jgi:PAS domain S-box-containing protein